MGSILNTMDNLIDKMSIDEDLNKEIGQFGIFVMGRKSMREFKDEIKKTSGRYKGHKIRMMKDCPENKIYLMSKQDYLEIKYGVERASKN